MQVASLDEKGGEFTLGYQLILERRSSYKMDLIS